MKRKLDEIELEEIEHFYIDQTTLIVKTKNEKILYQYPNQLELLRRIGYLLHRYEVEHNRKAKKTNSDYNQNEHLKNIEKSSKILFKTIFLYFIFGPPIMILFPNIYWYVVSFVFMINLGVQVYTVKEAVKLRKERIKNREAQKQYELQIEKGYKSLEEICLSYLNKITKEITNFNADEKYYIEVIEKGFQKRIGTYPQQ